MPETEKYQSSLYGVVIKVENLNACRAFYRDVLNLGAPVVDSNFWVEFKITSSSSLILEQAAKTEKLPVGHGKISWICVVDNLEETVTRLLDNACEPLSEETERLGIKVAKYSDPEGNPFYLAAKKDFE